MRTTNVRLLGQFRAALPEIRVKTHEQTFSGAVFVLQKTCVTRVDFSRISHANELMELVRRYEIAGRLLHQPMIRAAMR